MKIQKNGFIAIPVTDMKRAREFYEGVLGLKESINFHEGTWVEYKIGDDTVAISNVSDTWRPSDQGQRLAFEMENFDAAIAELREANITFAREPFESPVCHMAIVQDPDGNKLIIHKLKSL